MCYQWIRNCLSFESTQVHSRLLYGFVLPNFYFSEQHLIGNFRFVLLHLAIVLSILLRLIAKFKTELRKRKDISQVPKHYEIRHRKLNIILTQVRCFASFMNYDLFQINIVPGLSCRCDANREDSYHFFFDCFHYSNIRHTVHCFKISTGYLIIVFQTLVILHSHMNRTKLFSSTCLNI